MTDYMKTPCKHCPFRSDIKPFLHPERAAEIAYAAENRYSSFACHKTTEYNEYIEDMEQTEKSKECAGFLTLRAQCGEDVPDGFEPAWEVCYTDPYDMITAYEEAYNETYLK